MDSIDCTIGDDMRCTSCGRLAQSRSIRRNCSGLFADKQKLPVEEYAKLFVGGAVATAVVIASGPGTELKKLLSRFGIKATEGCSCNSMAAKMDAAGPDGSEAMMDDILSVMRAEASRRGLPWSNTAARLLVKKAIKTARQKNRLFAEFRP